MWSGGFGGQKNHLLSTGIEQLVFSRPLCSVVIRADFVKDLF